MTARIFSIIGDANVRRNMTSLNIASREVMKAAQVIDYLGVSPVNQALQEVRDESNICIFAGITEPLLTNGDCGTINASVDPVLHEIFASLSSFCLAHPALQVRVSFNGSIYISLRSPKTFQRPLFCLVQYICCSCEPCYFWSTSSQLIYAYHARLDLC